MSKLIYQFGLGSWGKNHNRILTGKGCEVRVIEIEEFHRYMDFLKCDMDAVFITTSSVSHMPITLRCLEEGIPVFCEKPIITKRSQIELLRPYEDRFFMSGHQLVFADEIRELKEKPVSYVMSMRSGAIPRDEGAILSLAVHDLAILNYLSPDEPFRVVESVGNKHEAKITVDNGEIYSDIYVRSFSDLKLRHMTLMMQYGEVRSFRPDNWGRIDLLDIEIDYFLDCVDRSIKPEINDLKSTLNVMETVFDARDTQNGSH